MTSVSDQHQQDAHCAPEVIPIPTEGFSSLSGELHRSHGEHTASLLWLPAMGVPARYYRRFGAALAVNGIDTLVMDLRGQGASEPANGRHSNHDYAHLVNVDCAAAIASLKEVAGGGPVLVGGHSLGGHIAVLYASITAAKPDGIVLVAAQNPHHSGYRGFGRLRMLLAPQLIAAITNIWGYWPGHKLGFGGRQPKRLINDWARVCRGGRWPKGGTADFGVAMAALDLPVFAASIEGDQDAPPAAVNRLCEQLGQASITRWDFAPEEPLSSPHLGWARRVPAPIALRIAQWVKAECTAAFEGRRG